MAQDQRGAKNPNYRGGFETKCSKCDAMVWVQPSHVKYKQHFCSKACGAAWRSENVSGADHWRFQGGDVERTCGACQVRFHQTRKGFNQSPAKYCSRKCSSVGSRRRVERVCELCLTDFSVLAHKKDARFCSTACKKLSQVKERTAEEIARMRLNRRMGTLMWWCLKSKKAGRAWESLTDYTCNELMRHLEALFQPGMTWENMGDWHVDHIRPRSSFSYGDASDPEFRVCWAMTNLRPLWKLDNLRKGAKYTEPEPDNPEGQEPCRSTPT